MEEIKQISHTITNFAAIVGVTKATVHNWINRGTLKTIDIPGGWRRIPDSEVKRFKGEE